MPLLLSYKLLCPQVISLRLFMLHIMTRDTIKITLNKAQVNRLKGTRAFPTASEFTTGLFCGDITQNCYIIRHYKLSIVPIRYLLDERLPNHTEVHCSKQVLHVSATSYYTRRKLKPMYFRSSWTNRCHFQICLGYSRLFLARKDLHTLDARQDER